MSRVRWGVLSTAKIGVDSVIPGLKKSEVNEVLAISSRNGDRARAVAAELDIPRAYGSYEELLADPDVDAVYIPLPNHMHVPWSIRALDAGKHVLCEKPLGLSADEAQALLEHARARSGLKVMEAFMYRHHPQWRRALELVSSGELGRLQTIHSFFSYFKTDPQNIRNRSEMGGGGLLDIGCYCISLSRFLWQAEPRRVVGTVDHDPELGIDRLISGIMEFDGGGTATFTCATQLSPYQRVNALGSRGRLEIERPFNAPPDGQTRLWLENGKGTEEMVIPAADQYAEQGELFAKAILEDGPVPTPLEDAVANLRVIDAIFESGRTGNWVELA